MEQDRRAALKAAFGARMRALRHVLGISQDELAFRSGLHRTYIGSAERGELNLSLVNIVRIAETLQVPPAALLEGGEQLAGPPAGVSPDHGPPAG